MNFVNDALFGLSIGDALGVPVEFKSRAILQINPITDMIGNGTHNQPSGTWSDDSSLTFCLAESLCEGYNLRDIANRFINWYDDAYWTAHNEVFDVGIATSKSITKLKYENSSLIGGNIDEMSNGNGSLMRILPIICFTNDKPIQERFRIIKEVSSLTHGHIRSILSCFIYTEMALFLLKKTEKFKAFELTGKIVNEFLSSNNVCSVNEIDRFHRILLNPIGDYVIKPVYEYDESEIESSGYVIHSLEASLWCLLKCNSYEETVLKAVNLGSDTDTTAAISGGLAGLLYGFENIPVKWIDKLARKDDILNLSERLFNKFYPIK